MSPDVAVQTNPVPLSSAVFAQIKADLDPFFIRDRGGRVEDAGVLPVSGKALPMFRCWHSERGDLILDIGIRNLDAAAKGNPRFYDLRNLRIWAIPDGADAVIVKGQIISKYTIRFTLPPFSTHRLGLRLSDNVGPEVDLWSNLSPDAKMPIAGTFDE